MERSIMQHRKLRPLTTIGTHHIKEHIKNCISTIGQQIIRTKKATTQKHTNRSIMTDMAIISTIRIMGIMSGQELHPEVQNMNGVSLIL